MFGVKFIVNYKRPCGHLGEYWSDGSALSEEQRNGLEKGANLKPCRKCG
jgi:hypothetical protein